MTASEQDKTTQAIDVAVDAARRAGINIDRDAELSLDVENRPKVSYSFELTNLPDAPDVGDIERALEELPGVHARLVHPQKTVWVTAPDITDPSELVRVIEQFGVSATMSETSLRRRIAWVRAPETVAYRRSTRGSTGMSASLRRHQNDEAKALESARSAGFLKESANQARRDTHSTDVLYTARNLITPLRLIIALLFSIPVVLVSYFKDLQFPGWQWAALAAATPVVLWCAWPFHRALVGGVRRGLTALDGASSLAIIVAYIWSIVLLVATPAGEIGWTSEPKLLAFNHSTLADGELFLDVACGMTVLLLAGRLWTMRARPSFVEEIDKQRVDPATLVKVSQRNRSTGAVTQSKVPLAEVNPGDDIALRAGDIIPVDGNVIGGSCTLDPGIVDTRENTKVKVGAEVYAGAQIISGKIKVRVERTGHRTRLAAIRRWVQEAAEHQNHATFLSTRTASWLIPVAVVLAIVDFIAWAALTNNFNAAMATALAVLASVAPTALALSPSLAVRLGLESAARNGIMVRDGSTLRRLDRVDTVIFNRVGTLVEPGMYVESVVAERGENPDMVLRVAGALSMESDHPVSQALVRAAREARDHASDDTEVPHWIEVSHFESGADGSFKARIDITTKDARGEDQVHQVEAMLWRPTNLSRLRGRLAAAATSGGTPIVVRWKGKDRGVITLYDPVKDDAGESVDRLEEMGIETVMLSRDIYPVARRFADHLGISTVLAGIEPKDKPGAVRAMHTQGACVATVGDLSVLPSLRASDVGVLVSAGENLDLGRDLRRELSLVVLRDDVAAIPQLIEQARRVCSVIDRNIVVSWIYNLTVMAVAVSGVLHPMVATVLMLGASLFVEARSVSVKKFPRD
ncbi:heavy metal translocating P-type ATPase [Corynebacterium lubricantis]|uniref:heavy metal translocating P-type ATPase n=1 Tax=Corynebacterium lubricantis TaxID=541095 RepID=UPI00035E017E|nr:HAD family hydrolase [Corynebacterium lubricantis]